MMEGIPMKMMWMGEDVETLHRDVLIEIIRQLHRDLESTRNITRATIAINRAAREASSRCR